jgi:hypothetical protein
MALSRPSFVLLKIRWRSNSANPPRIVTMSFPWAVVVSAQTSPSDLKLAPFSLIACRVLSRSRVLRASRSSLVRRTSPSPSEAKQRAKAARPVFTPDCFQPYTCSAPAARRASSWASYDCPSLETLQYP